MEDGEVLMDLGKACEVCSLVEFKPYQCVRCKHYFCAEHRNNHKCVPAPAGSVNTTVTCPLCSKVIVVKAGEDTNARVDAHISQGCPDEGPKIYTCCCSFPKCTKTEMVPFTCGKCKKSYCTVHRLPEDHNCPSCRKRSSSPPPSPISTKKPADTGKKKYSPSVFRFLEISKRRKTALGEDNIAPTQRIYYEVFFPESFNKESVFVYLDKSWTAGKGNLLRIHIGCLAFTHNFFFNVALDKIAAYTKIKNNNHSTTTHVNER